MARYEKAEWRPVARYLPDGSVAVAQTVWDIAVVHIEVSEWSPDQAFNWYNTPGRSVPHFRLHTPTGHLDQYIDTDIRSTATLEGNPRVISLEMWGMPEGDNSFTLPSVAVEVLAEWMVWCHKRHNIPLVECPNSKPTSRGIAWHRRGIDGNFPEPPGSLLGGRVAGGELWSTSFGKICPTSSVIKQLHNQIIPRAIEINEGDIVTPEDVQRIANAVWAQGIINLETPEEDTLSAGRMFAQIHNRTGDIRTIALDIRAALNELGVTVTQGAMEAALKKVRFSLVE